ncbi:MAG: sulfatase-like hydrolase/transferase [Pseudomonadota bacterium]
MAGVAGLGLKWFVKEAPGSRGVDQNAAIPKSRKDLNLLIIMVDQERPWDTLPADIDLPHRFRIAERGTSFTNMNVTSPLCTPSRSVFWTGQHVQHTRVQDNTNVPLVGRPLNPAIPTLGHMLRDAGFYTAYKGKWHLHELPKDVAWEQSSRRSDALEDYGFSDYGWGPEFIDEQAGWKYDGKIADDAARWLTGQSDGVGKPWALTVSFVNPHDIMYFDATGEQAKTRIQNVFPGPVLPSPDDPMYKVDRWGDAPRNFRSSDYPGQMPAQADYDRYMDYFYGEMPHDNVEAWIRFSQYYVNCIRDVDRHIGTVLDALEATGQADRTVIALVSDHGEMGGVHGLRQKGPWMYRENIGVPFVVSHPDCRGQSTNPGIVSAVDFAPTMLGLVGMEAQAVKQRYTAMRGSDVSEHLGSRATPRSETGEGALITYSVGHHIDTEFARANFEKRRTNETDDDFERQAEAGWVPDLSPRGFMRGIVTDEYKFARYFSPREHHTPTSLETLKARNDLELFDLKSDPGETKNLATAPGTSDDLVLSLNDKLNALIAAEVGPDDGRDLTGPTFFWRA